MRIYGRMSWRAMIVDGGLSDKAEMMCEGEKLVFRGVAFA